MDSIGSPSLITGGVDTHKDTHTVAALDAAGRLLGNQMFVASGVGYTTLITWLRGLGEDPKNACATSAEAGP